MMGIGLLKISLIGSSIGESLDPPPTGGLDTPEKRRAAAGVPFVPLGLGVTPNASKGVAWRKQAAWSYPV